MNYIWISDKILKFINLKSQIFSPNPKSQIILPPKSQIPKILTPQIPNPKYHNTPPIEVFSSISVHVKCLYPLQ